MFKQKLKVYLGFIFINVLFAVGLAIRYFQYLPELPKDGLSQLFIVSSTLGNMALLGGLFGILFFPSLFLPQRIRFFCQAIFVSLVLALLYFDTLVFAQYRFHINAVVVNLVFSGQVVSIPLITWLSSIAGFLLLFFAEWKILLWLEKNPKLFSKNRLKRVFFTALLALLISNVLHAWASANAYQSILRTKLYLPLFYPASANKIFRKIGWIDNEVIEQRKQMSLKLTRNINYPTSPLLKQSIEQPTDIIIIVIDSWRFDTFDEKITPNLWQLAKQGEFFNQHYSTGNSTRAGIFGLFYGMPGTYWHTFFANQQSPILIDRMIELNYQMGIFASAQLFNPEFDQTVFKNIINLRTESKGDSAPERDLSLTDDWISWYNNRETSLPSFSFLFYDSPHAYDFPKEYPNRFEPMVEQINYLELDNELDPTPIFNRYKTSVNFVDSLIQEVIQTLKDNQTINDSLIIITGDHGQEMNDNQLNYWGHNSNFTDVQVKVPLIIIDTKKSLAGIEQNKNNLTSHQDIAPTLLKNILGISSYVNSYAIGKDMTQDLSSQKWLLASQYSGYAVIDDSSILEVKALGDYMLMDKANRPIEENDTTLKNIPEVLEQISRFNK